MTPRTQCLPDYRTYLCAYKLAEAWQCPQGLPAQVQTEEDPKQRGESEQGLPLLIKKLFAIDSFEDTGNQLSERKDYRVYQPHAGAGPRPRNS